MLKSILLIVVVVVFAGAVGFVFAGLGGDPVGEESAVTEADLDRSVADEGGGEGDDVVYYEIDVPAVNPREERLTRYIKTKIMLKIKQENEELALKRIEQKNPEIMNWLVVNLSEHTIEEISGARNKRRLERQILDAINGLIVTGQGNKALVEDALFVELLVE